MLVSWWPLSSGGLHVYYAPEGTPELRIVDVEDDVVMLDAADGRRFSFDIEKGDLVEL